MNLKEMGGLLDRELGFDLNLRTFLTPEGILHRDGPAGRFGDGLAMPLQAGWFTAAAAEESPVIAVWEPQFLPWTAENDRAKDFFRLEKALQELGFVVHLTRLNGNEIQLFLTFGPGNILQRLSIEMDSQLSVGKQMKRLGILSVARGACFQSQHWWVNGSVTTVTEYDRPEADGGLKISAFFAHRLMTACGLSADELNYDPEVTRMQLWMASHTGLVKGMAVVDDCQDMDLVMPVESFDSGFRVMEGTLVKIIPHRVQRNVPCLKAMDGLLRIPELIKAVSFTELLSVQKEGFADIDAHFREVAWESQYPEETDLELLLESGDEPFLRNLDRVERRLRRYAYRETSRQLCDEAGGSLFIAPQVMREATGSLLSSVTAHQRRWNGLPGLYVSCLRGYWTDYRYAGMHDLKPNYAGLLWNGTDFDGFALHGRDVLSDDMKARTDGGDGDDLLDGIMMRDELGQVWVRLYRNPSGYGAGVLLRLDDFSAELAQQRGYHVYRMLAGYEDPDLPAKLQSGIGLQVRSY